MIFEKRLDLELFVAVTDFAEAVFVSFATETRNVAHDVDFLRGFCDTRFIKDVEKLGVIARVLLQEGEIRYLERAFGVGIFALIVVDFGRIELLEMSVELVDIEDRVDRIFGLEVLLTLDHCPHFV